MRLWGINCSWTEWMFYVSWSLVVRAGVAIYHKVRKATEKVLFKERWILVIRGAADSRPYNIPWTKPRSYQGEKTLLDKYRLLFFPPTMHVALPLCARGVLYTSPAVPGSDGCGCTLNCRSSVSLIRKFDPFVGGKGDNV